MLLSSAYKKEGLHQRVTSYKQIPIKLLDPSTQTSRLIQHRVSRIIVENKQFVKAGEQKLEHKRFIRNDYEDFKKKSVDLELGASKAHGEFAIVADWRYTVLSMLISSG